MSTTVHLQVAPRVGPAYPRGSRLAATLWLALRRALSARPQPAPAQRTAGQEAQEEARAVRELALTYRAADPAFAADLLAAADRHERLHGID
jgi:hypothetical protein